MFIPCCMIIQKEKFEKMSWLIITTAIPAISWKLWTFFFYFTRFLLLLHFVFAVKLFFIPSFYEILIFLSVSATFHPTLSSLIRERESERDVKWNFCECCHALHKCNFNDKSFAFKLSILIKTWKSLKVFP